MTRPRRGSKVIVDIEEKPKRAKPAPLLPGTTEPLLRRQKSTVDSGKDLESSTSSAPPSTKSMKKSDSSTSVNSDSGAAPASAGSDASSAGGDSTPTSPASPRNQSRPSLQRRQESKSLKVSSHSIKITAVQSPEAAEKDAKEKEPASGSLSPSSSSNNLSQSSPNNALRASTLGRSSKLSKLLGVENIDDAMSGKAGTPPLSPRERSATVDMSSSTPASPSTQPVFELKRNVVIQTDASGTQSIRGGTVSELVRQLIGTSDTETEVDNTKFMQTFLLTYHSFMTSLQFWQKLEEAVRILS
jgi:hypothetical protein